MWVFDKEKDVTPEKAVQYVNEGLISAIKGFPPSLMEDKGIIKALCEAGHQSIAIKYCSEDLKQDKSFLKDIAHYFNNEAKEQFLKNIPEEFRSEIDFAPIKQENNYEKMLKNKKLLINNEKNVKDINTKILLKK